MNYLDTIKAIERCLALVDSPRAAEFEGLREAYLAQHERPEPSPQLPLLAVKECDGW